MVLIFAWAPVARAQLAANPHAVALVGFEDRAKAYLALRDKVKATMAPPKPTNDPGQLVARQEALARAVRKARAGAAPGDIFTRDVAPILRGAIQRDFGRRTAAERAAALREVPSALALKVNDSYPKSVPLATVPPKLLAEMPRLPDSLEYRFVGRRLILHDTVSNLVVDILEEALPPRR